MEDDHSSTIPFLLHSIGKHLNGEHISLGNFNLHHPMWGGEDISHTDPGATNVIHFMHEKNMEQALPRSTTTYKECVHKSTIGLVFATKLLVDNLISCQTSDKYDHDSNYLPILSSWNLQTLGRPVEEKRHFKKTDIKKLPDTFLNELRDSIQTVPEFTQELDHQVGILVTAVGKAIEVLTPILRLFPRSIPGFDEECKEAQMRARSLKKSVKKIFHRSFGRNIDRAFKEKLINMKKQGVYREYCNKACKSPHTMWKACNTTRQISTRHAYLPAFRRPENSLTDDPREKIEILKQKIFPESLNEKLDSIENYIYPEAIETPPITDREIMAVILW